MALDRNRWMLIDDIAEDVSYSGDWFVDTYAKPGPFQWVGCATGGTAHGTNTAGGFAFSFEGTELLVRGQSNVIPSSTNSVLRCTIDGEEGESDVVNSGNLRSWKLCGKSRLSAGRHQVVVNITAGPNTLMWLDEIYYYSLSKPNLRRQASMLYSHTEEFKYTGVSWVNPFDEAGSHGRESYQNGAKATIPFYGQRVELVSYMTSSMPRLPGAGTYSVDGGPPVNFVMPAWISGFRGIPSNDSMWRQTIFSTPTVSPGYHTLEVTNLGNASTVPLSIDYFLVYHGDVDATTATGTAPNINTKANTGSVTTLKPGGPSGLTSDAPPTQSGQKNNIGIIVGAVVGVLVLLAAAVFLFFWIRKRRKAKTLSPSNQWTHDESAALSLHPHGIPLDATPYHDAPGPGVFSPPGYTESDGGFTAPQHTVMHYQAVPQQTMAMQYQPVPQQMGMYYGAAPQQAGTYYEAAPQQAGMYYEMAPQQPVMGYPAVPQQTETHPQVTPFMHTSTLATPPLRRLPPEKFRTARSVESESTSRSPPPPPSSSSTYSHGSTQSPVATPRTMPPQLSPSERLTDSSESQRSSSVHSKTKSGRAVPPRVPSRVPPPPPPPRRVPPRLPPARVESQSEPPVYHE